ncbi:MAG: hypothetical protein KKA73_18510 [Chloroflexi bacterium]|nr:hypothetical protein [Chloroflexota bacterium]MBU1749681.1 hypothetical protein [Chloroflexota bacterium]
MHSKRTLMTTLALALLALALAGGPGLAQGPQPDSDTSLAPLGTGFTYQGQLKQDGTPVASTCDLQFGLYDAASLGAQLGVTQTVPSVGVAGGLFTVQLNDSGQFGSNAFNGDARWLAIAVRCPAGSGSYTSLGRQALTATPYALYAQRVKGYQNVVVVAKSGGNYTSVRDALASIMTASDTNRYLVWVAPGTYTELVMMKPYVDIEGAGELLTKITYTGSSGYDTGTVVGASNAELRFLTVWNTGGAACAIAIYNNNASPDLTHVTTSASGGSSYNLGVYNCNSSYPRMTHVTASALGGTNCRGVQNDGSSPEMTNVTATGMGGTTNYGVYNGYSSSPTMNHVTATGMGGATNYGVYNYYSSSPTIQNCTIGAGAGGYNFGVYSFSSSPTIQNSAISASGGPLPYGVYNEASSLTIQNSIISANWGTTSNCGVANYATSGSYTVKIDSCQITGATHTISNDTEFTTHIGASQLDGGNIALNGGTVTCYACYDENYINAGGVGTCP